MTNETIRKQAEQSGVCLWQIADALGVTDSTFSRWLRKELPASKQAEILVIIERLKGGVA